MIASTEELIEEARQGRPFIIVDDAARENEGDLSIPACFATPEIVNLMIKEARGLVCLALSKDQTDRLGLSPMVLVNKSLHNTAFTASIEAAEGVTTGISAFDRARTIEVAINPLSGPEAIVSPGHMFPLIAQPDGVLARRGHTEAVVDIARLAGLPPSGVICEIVNDDGTMARLPDLLRFAKRLKVKIGTVADLVAYREALSEREDSRAA